LLSEVANTTLEVASVPCELNGPIPSCFPLNARDLVDQELSQTAFGKVEAPGSGLPLNQRPVLANCLYLALAPAGGGHLADADRRYRAIGGSGAALSRARLDIRFVPAATRKKKLSGSKPHR